MREARECPSHPAFSLFPCTMVVAISMGEVYGGTGCVVRYEGELGHGIKELLDDCAGSLEELFCDGATLPLEPGIYRFIGDARVCMMGGSDEPITFDGDFQILPMPMVWFSRFHKSTAALR